MKKHYNFKALSQGVKALAVILLVAVMAVGNVFAESVTYVFSEQGYTNGQLLESGTINDNISFVCTQGNSSTPGPKYYTTGAAVRFYYSSDGNGNAMTLIPAVGTAITGLEITALSGNTPTVKYVIDGGQESTASLNGLVYSISNINAASSLKFFNANSSSAQLRATQITIYYETNTITVAAPAVTPISGTYYVPQTVSISAQNGATIYYTIDGTTPTENSTVYTEPFVVNATTTVKAIAVDGEDVSAVTTSAYTITLPIEVANIAAFKAVDNTSNIYKITGDVTVIGQYSNKYHTFIQDNTGALYIYGTMANAYNSGDVISGGVCGTYSLYNGLIEMKPVAALPAAEGTPGTAIDPIVATLDQISSYYNLYEGKLVTVKGLTFTEDRTFGTNSATKGAAATQGNNTIKVYNTWGAITGVEVTESMAANVTGYIIRYNDDIEIVPRGSEDIIEAVGPATTPWNATFDDLAENSAWEIDNSGANNTNKWYVGQAQGFDNNKLYISSNNGVTNKYDVTVSSVVRASRAIIVPEAGAVLSFDYRVNGRANYDYLQVDIVKDGNSTQLARLSGTNDWTNATYTILPELSGNATLVFTWANAGSNGEQFPAAIDNITMTETPCAQPTALQVLVNGTNANISWTGDAAAYQLQYKLADHSEWYSINTTETSVSLSDLQGNSNYNVRVQSVCNDVASDWTTANFSVDCQSLEETTSTEEVVIGTGTSTQTRLFNGYYGFGYSANLYTMTKAGTIHSIAFYQSSSVSSTGASLDLWVKAVPADYTLASSYTFNNMLEGAQQICSGVSDFSTSGWKVFNIEDGFTLAEGQNLLVLSKAKGCSPSGGCSKNVRYTTSSNKVWYKEADNNDPGQNVSGSITNQLPNITINMDIRTIVCGDVEACPAVTNLTVSNVGASTADVAWTAGNEDETNFIVEYKTAEDAAWTSIDVNGATTYTLTGLSQMSDYQVRVKANCGTNNQSEPVTATFTTLSICAPVTNLSASNNSNTTTLTWTPGSTETNWLVQFKPVTAGDNEWISINADILPTITFGGLLSMTEYVVRVKALCDPNDEANQSTWAEYMFTSGCAAVDAPFAEAFDSYSMPSCWDANDFYFSGGYTYSYDQDAWIMTPAINIPSDETTYISFDIRGAGDFKVLASYRGTDPSRFAEIYTGTITSSSNYTQVVVPIAANLKGRQVYFKIVNTADQYQYIDNLSIDYCPFIPAQLTASNITENTAVLSWTAAEAANNFQVKVGEDIFDVEGANTYTVTGLEASTTYTFAVRTQCGEDNFGVWSAEAEFQTACPSVALPLFESFESSSCPADCWEIVYASDNPSVNTMTHSTDKSSDGQKSFRFSSMARTSPLDQYLITPKLANHGELLLTFDYANYNNTSTEVFKVGYSTTTNDVNAFTWSSPITNTSTSWQTYSATVPSDAKYIAIDYYSDYMYYLYVDNFNLTALPTCGTPSIAVNGTTATITRSTIGTPESYDLQIGNEIQTVTETTVDLTSIFTLAPSSTYEVSVRANCSADDQSEWSQPVSFETPCAAVALPLFESFESSTCPADCWTIIYGSGTPSTNTMIHTTDQHSVGQKSFRFSSFSNASDYNQYLITPELANHGELMLSFDYKRSNGSEQFRVGYSTTTNDIRAFTWGSYITNATANWQEYTQTLPSDVKYIAINYNSNYSYYLYIDNLNIMAAPTCGTPSIAVNGTTATITRNSIGTPVSYDLQIGNAVQNVTTTTCDLSTLFELDGNTEYQVSVRANCDDGDYSEWSQAVSFVTPCLALELPYVQDFEGTAFPPECWSQEYVSGTHNWTRTSNTSYGVGTYNATFAHTSSGTSTKLITPAFNLASLTAVQLTFKHRQVDWSGDQDVLTVYYRPSTSASWVRLEEYAISVSTATLQTIALPAAALTANCQFAFEGYDSYGHGIYIDDVTVEAMPTCFVPSNLEVNVTSAESANITWSDSHNQSAYRLQYRLESENGWTDVDGITGTNYTLTGLQSGSNYVVRVLAVCGDNDESEPTEEVGFNTPCLGAVAVTIGTGSSSNTYVPSDSYFNYSLTEQIYTAAELGEAGTINALSLYSNGTSMTRTMDIYLVQTNKTSFSSSSDWVHPTDANLVYSGSITFTANSWINIPFSQGFEYNGADNVVLVIDDNTGSYISGLSCASTSASSNSVLYVYNDNTNYNPITASYSGTLISNRNNVKFSICPAPAPTCPRPTNLVVSNVTSTSVDLAWTAGGEETQWKVEYGESGFAEGEGTITVVTEPNVVLSALSSATNYDVYVTAICSEDDHSSALSGMFMTECGLASLPYFENFDSYTSSTTYSSSTMPTCWDRLYTGTSTSYGASIYPSSTYSYSGNNSLRLYVYGTTSTSDSYGNAYAILPEMDADLNVLGMELYARKYSTYNSEFEVGVVTDVNDPENTFVSVQTIAPTSTSYEKFEVLFAEYTGANGHIAFRMMKPNSSKYVYIDNITVKQVVFAKDLALTSMDPIGYSCDQSDAQVTVHVENAGNVETITSFVANYQINDGATVSETVNCNLAPGETMSYTFNTLPVIGENASIRAYVTMDGDMNEENNNANPIYTEQLVPETVPYVANLNNAVVNHGWNVADANEDEVTMNIKNGAIVYDFNDEAAADDWMFTPCVEMTAGTYNVYYDYKANSSLNEKFELYYGNNDKAAAMTHAVANHDFNNTDYETAMQTITVTEDGVYNFGFHATSLAGNLGFSIKNFKIYPVNDVVVTSNANGTVTPDGVVPVNYGEDLSINIVPNAMYHLGGIYVDGVQVVNEDPYGSNFILYTLENVTAPHTIYVDYKLEFHIIKNAVNARPDLYTENGGYFIPAATDTLIDPSAVTVTFAPEAHYHFADLVLGIRNMDDPINVTADVVNNGNGTYSYTIDTLVVSNYYVQATFRKDTINIHYNILAGNGYVDASDLLTAPASYDTWIDYGTNHTASIVPANGYYLIDVNGAGPVADYQVNNVTAQTDVNVKFGFLVTAEVNNLLPSYLGSSAARGTIAPDTTYILGGESLTLNGTVENLFHLSSFLIDGVENIQDVDINNDGTYSYTFAEVLGNHHVNAIVAIDTVGVHYTVTGNGIVDNHAVETSATFDHYVDYGTTFNAMFVPAIGYHVAGVTINGVFYGNIDEWQFANLTGEQYVTVVFEKNVYTITTAGYGQGTVSDGETFEYDPEHTYTFTATPAAGYHIESILRNNVELNVADPEATYTETLTNILSDYNYNVVFNPSQYTVTATAGANGLITPAGVTSYYYNNQAVYNVTADLGYYINTLTIDGVSVTLDPATTTASHTFTFTGENAHNHTIAATFARLQYTVTVNAGAHGTITPGTATYNYGATPTYTITPEAGYGIVDVTVDGHSVGAVSSYTFTSLTDNHTIAATFVQYEYTIQASAGNGGTITPSGLINVTHGGTQNFTITPANGYHIAAIYVDGEAAAVANQYTFASIDANHTIHAMFEANTYTVTVNQPNNGVITPGTMTVAYGATPTYVVTPNTGYNVTAITVNGTNVISSAVNTNGVYSYTMAPITADATVTATMTQRTFTINATAGAHGTINGPSTVNYGANATYTITPAAGYVVDNVTVDGMAAGAVTSYTFTNVVANHTINATFRTEDCDVPTNMHTVDVTTSTATFMWYHPTATAFEVQYKAVDAAAYTTVNVNAMSYDVIDLTPSTSYVWMVRANCGNGNYSEWSNGNIFRTLDVPDIHDGIEDYNVKEMVNVYASHSNVYIVNEGNVQIDNVQIFDIYGKMVYNGKVSSNNEVISMNVATGAYMVRLTTDKGMATYKVVLTK